LLLQIFFAHAKYLIKPN